MVILEVVDLTQELMPLVAQLVEEEEAVEGPLIKGRMLQQIILTGCH